MMNLRQYIKANIDEHFDGKLPFDVIERKVAKDFTFIDFNIHEENVYFLKEGIVQVAIQSKKETRVLDFIFPNSFFASYSSLLTAAPSDVRIVSMTECKVEVINYHQLKASYQYSLIANKLGRIETEKLYIRRVIREKNLLTKNAEEHYSSLLNRYPQIIHHIPLKEISKYLAITPESLSRIRKRVIS